MRHRNWSLVALLVLCFAAASRAQEEAADSGEWVEHFDKASGKPFYYHSVTRQTAWEPPAGAKVKYMEADGDSAKTAAGKGGGGSSAGMVMLAILLPIGLPFIGLLYCYWAASKEGLSDLLKELRKKRDRSSKRRGTKAGGNFRCGKSPLHASIHTLPFSAQPACDCSGSIRASIALRQATPETLARRQGRPQRQLVAFAGHLGPRSFPLVLPELMRHESILREKSRVSLIARSCFGTCLKLVGCQFVYSRRGMEA